MIYFEDARIEFFGVPLGYVPFMSAPDPTVKRKSGFLFPNITYTTQYGAGIKIPYFWALAPNYDLTLSTTVDHHARRAVPGRLAPTPDRGLVFDQGRWHFPSRPRLLCQSRRSQEPDRQTFRGAIQTAGQFAINDKWVWGWTGLLMTDTQFLFDYQLSQFTGSFDPFRTGVAAEGVSQLYLTGAGERSYFDIRTIYYYGFSELDNQKPDSDHSPGSRLLQRVAAAGVRRRARLQVQSHEPHASGRGVRRDHPGCRRQPELCASNSPPTSIPENCLLRGIAGTYTRVVRRGGLAAHPVHRTAAK